MVTVMRARRIDQETRRWIRDASDERTARKGYRFNEARGQFVVDWMRQFLRLYEGDSAGKPFECTDWQYEFVMRLHGWEFRSKHHKTAAGKPRWVRRFTRASGWVPKKNKKSPTLAALMMYHTFGDGEPGNHCYCLAKNGDQAKRSVAEHVHKMWLQSEELREQSNFNRTTMRLTYEAGKWSTLEPLSSDNVATQQAKEGLNGSIFVDETHVVDADLMAIVEFAGAYRAQPIQCELSTAGNNPEGYGKRQWDYGVKVASGAADDEDRFLFVDYSAPQDLTAAELASDPVKYGKLANPAWGHTINEEEFLASYQRSKRSTTELAKFMMYRLNVWQRSSNPWLRGADWEACTQPLGDDELRGAMCWAGLDGGGARDTTALVLLFRLDDGRYYLRPSYWLAEERAQELASDVRLLDWGRDGWLTLTPGHLANHRGMIDTYCELYERFRPEKLLFDPGGVATDVAEICERIGVDPEEHCVSFAQSPKNYSEACNRFEELVLERKLAHPGNPLLNWQAGNVKLKRTGDDYVKPIKPDHGSYQTVDGVQAAVMALAGEMTAGEPSMYENRREIDV